jgi:hypothetical protein
MCVLRESSRFDYISVQILLLTLNKVVQCVDMSETTTERQITYFDISIAGVPAGRVVFQLYNDLVPKTAENFRPFLTFLPPAARH